MADIWIPGNDRLALQMREPNLLVPRRKHVGPVQVNWANPITRGLRFCVSPLDRRLTNLVTGKGPSEWVSPGTVWYVGPYLGDMALASEHDVGMIWDVDIGVPEGITIGSLYREDTTIFDRGVGLGNSAGDYLMEYWSGAASYRWLNSGFGGGANVALPTETRVQDRLITSGLRGDYGQTLTGYYGNDVVSLGTFTASAGIGEVWFGLSSRPTADAVRARQLIIAVWDRKLSLAEWRSFRNDPFQIVINGFSSIPIPVGSSGPSNVSIFPDPIAASGLLSAIGATSVNKAASPIDGAGSLSGIQHISISRPADPMGAVGSLIGIPILSVHQIAEAIAAAGSLSGVASAGQAVLISAIPIDAAGTTSGDSAVSIGQAAAPIQGSGDLSALAAISVNRLATALSAGGSLQGTLSLSNGVVIASQPIAALASLHGLSVIAVDVSAQILSATGELLGTLQVTAPGNVLVSADPIQSAGSLQGSPVLDVAKGGVIGATGFTAGDGYASLVIEAAPIVGAGSTLGGYRIDVDIPVAVIDALGDVTGDLVRNVLQAAAAIVGNGQLVGTAQIVGPGQLGEITRPGIISNTPRYAVISITPRRGTLN